MRNKLAIISGFLGSVGDKYLNYQGDRDLKERLAMADRVEDIAGLELCYPRDFVDFRKLKSELDTYNFGVSAVNFRSRRDRQWMRGSFSSESREERREVVKDMKRAVDYAHELGCDRVTTCPLNEGHDYIFEIDYSRAYDYFIETIREVADHDRRVRICIEYKLNGPRARCLLGNAGEALAFCQAVGRENVGITLDIGHSLLSQERPAQSAVLLDREDRLFYIHLNDNDKHWDWDMIPGAHHLWDFIEFAYYLRRLDYTDWIAYDVFPKEVDTVETFNTVTANTKKIFELAERLEPEEMEGLFNRRNPAKTLQHLFSLL